VVDDLFFGNQSWGIRVGGYEFGDVKSEVKKERSREEQGGGVPRRL